jgi:hypothetical protein
MISQLEFSSRAALCRKLARQEPTNRGLWMAEAEGWLRLSKVRLRAEDHEIIGVGYHTTAGTRLRLLPAGAIAGWRFHPLESAALHGARQKRTSGNRSS